MAQEKQLQIVQPDQGLKQVARGMHGELAVANGIAEGASFLLTLPLAQPPA